MDQLHVVFQPNPAAAPLSNAVDLLLHIHRLPRPGDAPFLEMQVRRCQIDTLDPQKIHTFTHKNV